MQPPVIEREREKEVLERALKALQLQAGLVARVLEMEPDRRGPTGYRPDALIEIHVQKRRLKFLVEVKRIDRFEMATQVRAFWPPDAPIPLLLVAPYITAETAERCKQMKLFFLDGAGNAYIELPGFYLFITGKKLTADLLPAKGRRIATTAGLKIVFAILCRPQFLAETYRDIAEAAQVALGTVGLVMKGLEERKHVATFGTFRITPTEPAARPIARRRLLAPERLLQEWVPFYAATLRPKLNVRRFRAPNPDWTEKADLRPYGAYWGGEIAAQRMTGYLQPETATIYIQHKPTDLVAHHRLRADARGDIEILDVFWNPDRIPHEPGLVPPLLVYADLMATTETRNLEAARLIYNEHIAPDLQGTK